MAINVKPLEDRVLIKQNEAEEKTAGGIVLPDTAKEKPQRGTVEAVGPGKMLDSGKRASPGLKVGEQVFYAKYAGAEVEINGKKYVICRESDVLAAVEK